MPLIVYCCETNHTLKKYYRQAAEAPASIVCDKCQKDMKKTLRSPANTSTIVIDNGVMAKQVEVNPEIIAINEERANKNYSED